MNGAAPQGRPGENKTEAMLNLILFGPPGSGKGTQANNLVDKYNLLHISTGDLFRYEIGNQTTLGVEAKSYMDKGELVPDAVTIGMLRNKVEAHPEVEGYIFDGFPRTVAQAEALDELMDEKSQSISQLVMLVVDNDEIVRRLLERGKTSGRADDLAEGTIRNRIDVYEKQTTPVFDYYEAKGKAIKVDGQGSIDEIFGRLCGQIDGIDRADSVPRQFQPDKAGARADIQYRARAACIHVRLRHQLRKLIALTVGKTGVIAVGPRLIKVADIVGAVQCVSGVERRVFCHDPTLSSSCASVAGRSLKGP